jgi:hypothetical protein
MSPKAAFPDPTNLARTSPPPVFLRNDRSRLKPPFGEAFADGGFVALLAFQRDLALVRKAGARSMNGRPRRRSRSSALNVCKWVILSSAAIIGAVAKRIIGPCANDRYSDRHPPEAGSLQTSRSGLFGIWHGPGDRRALGIFNPFSFKAEYWRARATMTWWDMVAISLKPAQVALERQGA